MDKWFGLMQMQTQNVVLATPIQHAVLTTLAGEFIGLFLADGVLHMHYGVFGFVVVLSWLPIVVVAFRRPQHPTRFDRVIMFGGFPVIFFVLYLFSRYYFKIP